MSESTLNKIVLARRAADRLYRGLEKYDFPGWKLPGIQDLYLLVQFPEYVDEDVIEAVTKATSLKDPTYAQELTVAVMVAKAKANPWWKENYREDEIKPRIIQVPKTDEEWLELFPARTKNDIGIRRARMRDVIQLYTTDETLRLINVFRRLDYIHLMNVLWAIEIHGYELEEVMVQMGMERGLTAYNAGAQSLNMVTKKMKCSMELRLKYAELGNLTGYRLPPIPGFDAKEETKLLAQGGAEHGIAQWKEEFAECVAIVMQGQKIKRVPFVTLQQYIAEDMGSTAGASTIGKVYYESPNGDGKFKARKNFVLDVVDAEEVYQKTLKHREYQVAKGFIKPELGKCRVAVTGDSESYYISSWLNYLCGHSYVSWKGSTLEEDRYQQMARMEEMVEKLNGTYSLPFDYKGFDRQPALDEVEYMVREYFQAALENTPDEYKDYVNEWIESTVNSFKNSWCIYQEDGQEWKWAVSGGVQSGIRLTSMLGNFWNQVMTEAARRLVTVVERILGAYLRGDDSSVITKDYLSALLMRLGYAANNAVGADSKYGIHFEETEFLRIWYTKNRVYGYPNRAIASLTQRKPWTSEPWDPDAAVRAQDNTLNILERRTGRTFKRIRTIIQQAWVRQRKMALDYLYIPRSLGGLGIYPWNGVYRSIRYPDYKINRDVTFKVVANSWLRYQRKFDVLDRTQAKLTGEQLQRIQQEAMKGKAGGDDLPTLNRLNRELFAQELKQVGASSSKKEQIVVPYRTATDMVSTV